MRYFRNSESLIRPPPLVRTPIRSKSGQSGQGGQTRPASKYNLITIRTYVSVLQLHTHQVTNTCSYGTEGRRIIPAHAPLPANRLHCLKAGDNRRSSFRRAQFNCRRRSQLKNWQVLPIVYRFGIPISTGPYRRPILPACLGGAVLAPVANPDFRMVHNRRNLTDFQLRATPTIGRHATKRCKRGSPPFFAPHARKTWPLGIPNHKLDARELGALARAA